MVAAATLSKLNQGTFETKFKAGGYYIPVSCEVKKDQVFLNFPYNPELLLSVKTVFGGRKWHDEDKSWSFPINYRNLFQFEVLQGKYASDPYKRFDKQSDYSKNIIQYCEARGLKPYTHQTEMISHGLNTHWFIWAAEMGLGKSMAAIALMELSGVTDWIWVGPKNPLVVAQYEFKKWRSKIQPRFITYDGLRDLIQKWPSGKSAPTGVIFDEASRLKTPTAKRTIAARYLTDSMRQEHGEECYIGLLSGTPAPKTPADWWSLCEIACPGFLTEGNIFLFRQRLAVLQERETVAGAGKYNHLVGWRDDESKCHYCGKEAEHVNHSTDFRLKLKPDNKQTHEIHPFKKSINEVAKLSKRLKGLVGVWLKKDCLKELPEKRYEVIEVKPTRSTLNAAKLIVAKSTRAIDAHIRLRCLSDGFQYEEVETGRTICNCCKGSGRIDEYFNGSFLPSEEEVKEQARFNWEQDENGVWSVKDKIHTTFEIRNILCPNCLGDKTTPVYERQVQEVACPKDDILIGLLDRHEEIGRLNVYAGFTGSIDRIVKICHREGWATVRADGRGWAGCNPDGSAIAGTPASLLELYTDNKSDYEKVCFVGQPGAAGMGLTLVISPTTFFYSNDFVPENRLQAVDRGHRIGMDLVRGGLIVDCIHLPSDRKVLDSLNKSQDLQKMSMLGLQEMFTNDES